jgi:hypothetical protein
VRRNGAQELVRGNVIDVDEARGSPYKEQQTSKRDGEGCYWLAGFGNASVKSLQIMQFTLKVYSTDISRFRLLLLSSSATRMISLAPAPPTASIV